MYCDGSSSAYGREDSSIGCLNLTGGQQERTEEKREKKFLIGDDLASSHCSTLKVGALHRAPKQDTPAE